MQHVRKPKMINENGGAIVDLLAKCESNNAFYLSIHFPFFIDIDKNDDAIMNINYYELGEMRINYTFFFTLIRWRVTRII